MVARAKVQALKILCRMWGEVFFVPVEEVVTCNGFHPDNLRPVTVKIQSTKLRPLI